jgi:ParB family chromosome partitioning protein
VSVTLLPANPNELVASMRRAVYLDPSELRDNPRNLRSEIGDLSDLKASIPILGIMCPLIIVRVDDDGDGYWGLIIGHRRKYAALELGMAEVPCWIAENEDEALKIAAQLAENGHRVGLTATEEAEGFHQLMLMDWSLDKISAVRDMPIAEVKKTLRLRELPAEARQAADEGLLTLDDAVRMAEFAEEPTAMARILKAAGTTWGLQHAINGEKAKKAFAIAKERLKAQLVLDGVKVTSKPKGFPMGAEKSVKVLADADGNRVDPEVVKTWPGFAAFIEKDGIDKAQAVIYCTDLDKYGYTVPVPSYGPTPGRSVEEQAQREAEAAAKAEYLAGLALAEPVRQAFYKTAYGSAKAAKKLFVEALRSTVLEEDLPLYRAWDDLYTALGGAAVDALADAGEDRLRRCLVATWICRHEQNLALASTDRAWDIDETAAKWWLNLLTTDGYTLSDSEAKLQQEMSDVVADDRPLTAIPATLTGPPHTSAGPNVDSETEDQTAPDGEAPLIDDLSGDELDAALAELAEAEQATV